MTTSFERLLADKKNRRIYEQERLLVDTTELLATIMQERRVSRAELAQKLGKTKSFVTQVLSGEQNLTLRTIADLFFALDYRIAFKSLPLCCKADGTRMEEFELGGWTEPSARLGGFKIDADESLGLKISSKAEGSQTGKLLLWKGVAA